MKRVLLTDLYFPNTLARWRLVETKAFIEKYDTDILCMRLVGHPSVDIDELKESHSLHEYDILIFNPQYNFLNSHNDKEFNGTVYNNKHSCDFLLQKKKYRSTDFDVINYNAIYHIFLMCYKHFNLHYNYPHSNQFIHLYPGGGLFALADMKPVHPDTKIVSSQSFITDYINTNLPNEYINVYCAPFFNKDATVRQKNINPNSNELKICFTSLGNPEEKGANIYLQIVNTYKTKYNSDTVKFYSVGIVPPSINITHSPMMAQKDLDIFYYEHIDILFNLDTNKAIHGFPLGVEGMCNGCVLFTTDKYNLNTKNNFLYGDELVIIDINNIDHIVENIHTLHLDRELLHKKSTTALKKTYELFGYENTMQKVFDFIDNNKNLNKLSVKLTATNLMNDILQNITADFIGGCPIQKATHMLNIIIDNNLTNCVEIGVWKGRSLIPMVVGTKFTNGKAVGIDPYTAFNMNELDAPQHVLNHLPSAIKLINFDDVYNSLNNMLSKNFNNFSLIRKTAEDAIGEINFAIDLLHIDGNHDKDLVGTDIRLYVPKVRSGGFIIMDDTDWESVQSQIYLLKEQATKISDHHTYEVWKKL